jgi:hypothetical protein
MLTKSTPTHERICWVNFGWHHPCLMHSLFGWLHVCWIVQSLYFPTCIHAQCLSFNNKKIISFKEWLIGITYHFLGEWYDCTLSLKRCNTRFVTLVSFMCCVVVISQLWTFGGTFMLDLGEDCHKIWFFYMMHAPNQSVCSIFILQCTYHLVNRTCEHKEVMWCMYIMSMYELHICKMFNYDGFGHWRSNESIVIGVQFLLMPNFCLWGGHWFFSFWPSIRMWKFCKQSVRSPNFGMDYFISPQMLYVYE